MKKLKSILRPEYIAFLAIYLVLTGLHNFGVINSYLFQVITIAGINVIMTISLNMVIGITGQFSMGHAGFMSIGAYTGAVVSRLAYQMFSSGTAADELVLLVAMLCGGVVSAFFWVLDRYANLESARRLSGYCHIGLWRNRASGMACGGLYRRCPGVYWHSQADQFYLGVCYDPCGDVCQP